MSVLVTGGAGYIGSHMVHALIDKGEEVVVIDNLSTGFHAAVPLEATTFIGNCGSDNLVADIIAKYGVTEIIHLAASSVVSDSMSDPLGYYYNNTVNSLALITSAIKSGIKRFIFSSTAAVYGDPVSPYGSSKHMTETMLRDAAAAHEFDYVILRYFNVAGADPAMRCGQRTRKATHLIKVAVETALGKRPAMEVYGTDYPTRDGTCVRDYIHVTDLVWAHCDALEYLRGSSASVTLDCGYGYGHGFSVLEVINTVKRVSGVDFKVVNAMRRPGDSAYTVAKSEHIRELFDWKPQFDNLDAIVSHALAWERKL